MIIEVSRDDLRVTRAVEKMRLTIERDAAFVAALRAHPQPVAADIVGGERDRIHTAAMRERMQQISHTRVGRTAYDGRISPHGALPVREV